MVPCEEEKTLKGKPTGKKETRSCGQVKIPFSKVSYALRAIGLGTDSK